MMRYINHGLAGLMFALIVSFILTKAKLMNDQLFFPFLIVFVVIGVIIGVRSKDE